MPGLHININARCIESLGSMHDQSKCTVHPVLAKYLNEIDGLDKNNRYFKLSFARDHLDRYLEQHYYRWDTFKIPIPTSRMKADMAKIITILLKGETNVKYATARGYVLDACNPVLSNEEVEKYSGKRAYGKYKTSESVCPDPGTDVNTHVERFSLDSLQLWPGHM
jgi:hypothetical protein